MSLPMPIVCECGFATMSVQEAIEHYRAKHPEELEPTEEERMLKQLVTEQFEIWIDRRCIASAIYDALKEKGIKPTLEDCRELWLRFLQNSLNQGLEDEVLEMQVSQNYEEPE